MKNPFKKSAYIAAIIAVGCSQSEIQQPEGLSFQKDTVNLEIVGDDFSQTIWEEGDSISLFSSADTDANLKFLVSSKNGNQATFSGKVVNGKTFCAIYPYNKSNKLTIDGDMAFVSASVPGIQTADAVSDVYVSVFKDNHLSFYPSCATARFALRSEGDSESISAITLAGKGNENLSGPVKIMAFANGEPVMLPSGLTEGEKATLKGSWQLGSEPVVVDIKVAPADLDNGYIISVTKTDGIQSVKEYDERISLKSNNVTKLSDFVFEGPKFYITYSADNKLDVSGYKNEFDETSNTGKLFFNTSEVPEGILSGNTAIKGVAIPAEITAIGTMAFDNCTSLSSLAFEDGSNMTIIKDQAFRKTALKKLEFPKSLVTIGVQAFNNTGSLTTITFPDNSSLTTISQGAFNGSLKLANVVLPASVTSLDRCFNTKFSSNLIITIKAKTPPTLLSATGLFNVKFLNSIYVPAESVDAFKAAWTAYADFIKPMP